MDDFDEGTTKDFLDEYRFSDEEKEIAWEYCGGKPVCLVEIIKILDRFSNMESYAYEVITPEITYLFKENILFIDPVKCIMKNPAASRRVSLIIYNNTTT